VVFPKGNEVDVNSLEDEVKEGVEVILADEIAPLAERVLVPRGGNAKRAGQESI
jgi:hypothetical protein